MSAYRKSYGTKRSNYNFSYPKYRKGYSKPAYGNSGSYSRKSYKKPSAIVRHSNHCSVRVSHTEFITDLQSSMVFNNQVITANGANPGLALQPCDHDTFPWLANMAEQFEEWVPHSIKFHFKTTSTDLAGAGANPALGYVVMATDYNQYNPNFANKIQMENYEGAVSCKPSVNMWHKVNCTRAGTPIKELYCRPGALPANADQRLYDLGTFQVATGGMQSNQALIGGMRS